MGSLFPSLLLLWLLLFSIMFYKDMCSLRVQCNEKDHHLLLYFKHSVVDPSAILSTWSNERDCYDWRGVQCNNTTGRVINIRLPCSRVPSICIEEKSLCHTAELHLSLLQLESLNYLDLSNNDFHALMPNDYVDITNCHNPSAVTKCPHSCENSSNLHYLDLSYNEDLHIDNLQWLSRVSSLKYLNFSGINLQGKVDWNELAIMLPSITVLHLHSCQLRDINPSLKYANFTSLEDLDLYDNFFSLEFIPDWIFNLSDITSIDLSSNYFRGQLPNRLLNLRKIQSLDLFGNKFTGPIPDWLGQLEHLQHLDIADNLFSGPIPSTVGNLSSLITLYVYSNHLNGSLPESLGQLLNLEALELFDNYFTGDVSERNFIQLSNLKYLAILSPGLTFNFDSLWVPPFKLDLIYLEHMVSYEFPAWIYTQTYLSRLSFTYSTISLKPQDKFWDFVAQVPSLFLENNRIDWDMSKVLLNSTTISFDSNKFKGRLPQLSPNVVMFSAQNNSLQGSISPLLCQKMNGRSQLKYLDISNNLLSGGLTNCWMYWKSLVIVMLGNNNLTGTIPPSMSFLSNLTALHLSNNNLFGEIPLSLKNCKNLQILDVGNNKFSGYIPNWFRHNIKILRLRSNQFSGNISSHICQLSSLIIWDFADNKISGSIPTCLHNMTAMAFPHSSYNGVSTLCVVLLNITYVYVDGVTLHIKGQELSYQENVKFMPAINLSSNNMSATIPLEMFNLTDLHSLNLSHNQIMGNIPKEIGNLKPMESLDLASNQLSGEIPQIMAELSFLETLNLSFNNFIGEIPSGTQLQGFDALSYTGNLKLCGAPLPKNCTDKEDLKPIKENHSQEDEFMSSFYIGLGVGFATAFWGVCGAIFLN